MEDLTGLIDDVQRNNPLDLVTLPGRFHFKHDGKFGYNNQGGTNTQKGKRGHRAKIPTNAGQFGGGFGGADTPPRGIETYTTTSGVIPQNHT